LYPSECPSSFYTSISTIPSYPLPPTNSIGFSSHSPSPVGSLLQLFPWDQVSREKSLDLTFDGLDKGHILFDFKLLDDTSNIRKGLENLTLVAYHEKYLS